MEMEQAWVLTSTGFLGINTIRPVVETHIVHGFGSITHDLQISHVSLGTDHYWNLYTEIGGALELAADGNIVGTNDYILIPCTRQKGEEDRIKESLKPVLKRAFSKYLLKKGAIVAPFYILNIKVN